MKASISSARVIATYINPRSRRSCSALSTLGPAMNGIISQGESDLFRQVFEAAVRACLDAGLGFAVDASVMEADARRYHGKAPDAIDRSAPERQTRAVGEFLADLDDQEPNADRKTPKVISPTHPCSAWTAKANKRVQFGYGLSYMIDTENVVIVDVEATPARTYDEVTASKTCRRLCHAGGKKRVRAAQSGAASAEPGRPSIALGSAISNSS